MLILLTKGKPAKGLCVECRRLYEPTEAEMASQAGKRGIFVCKPCVAAIDRRCAWVNRRERKTV